MDLTDNSGGLYKKLVEYAQSDYYPFHMPGHKRQTIEFVNPYTIDITEIEGFDDLNHPDEIIKEALEEASRIYGSLSSYFLINGSTAGILTAVSASVSPKGRLLMARNCHKSAYHAAYLRRLKTQCLFPEWLQEWTCFGSVSPGEVEKSLQDDKCIEAVILVSPTYEGIVSDIAQISKICHQHNCILIVDEAHGAHFNFSKQWPKSALELGADLVIQSLHKTLPSFTQTAILHLGSTRVDKNKLEFFLNIFQTSSPSYLFMAGIQNCIRQMNSDGEQKFAIYADTLKKLRLKLSKLKHLHLLNPEQQDETYAYDFSKLVIFTEKFEGWDAKKLYKKLLEEYHLQAEMCTDEYVILMTSVCDCEVGFFRLANALSEIDKELCIGEKKVNEVSSLPLKNTFYHINQILPIAEALEGSLEWIELKKSIGKISGNYVYIYPPGIPLLLPGEKIAEDIYDTINHYLLTGLKVVGLSSMNKVKVVKF